MDYEKAEITVIRKYFSDLLRIMSKQTRAFNLPSWWSAISSEGEAKSRGWVGRG